MRSAIAVFPAFASWAFASVFLQAKLEMIWKDAGLEGSRAQWLISFSDGFRQNFFLFSIGVVLLLIALEFRVRKWERVRRTVLFAATVLLNTAVFVWVLGLATAALLAVPVLLRVK